MGLTSIVAQNSGLIARRRLLAGLVVLSFVLTSFQAVARPAPDSFADLVEKLLPAVVNISTVQNIEAPKDSEGGAPNVPPGTPFQEFFEEFFNQRGGRGAVPRRTVSLGSGFIISDDGYIVTNNHVIGEADEITVRLDEGKQYEAEVIGRDSQVDLVLLKIEVDGKLPFVKFGDSTKSRVGDWVLAIGSPFNLGGTVTAGIISSSRRNVGNSNYNNFLQTDASINRGNSGGPMFNMDGEVIGVNTMIFSPTGGNVGIGFAIPSTQADKIIDQLKEFGQVRRGWIGVSIGNVTEDTKEALGLKNTHGALIGSVVEDGPAAKAGILPGDIIVEFAGTKIKKMPELPLVVGQAGIDKTVKVKILREGKVKTLKLTTGELKPREEDAVEDDEAEEEEVTDKVLGMVLGNLTDTLRQQYDIPEDQSGVVIANLDPMSEAAARGIRPGDLIVQINQVNVATSAEVKERIEDVRKAKRKAVLFRIYRGGSFFHVAVPMKDDEEE